MTEEEVTRVLREKYNERAKHWPSQQPRAKKKVKLRARYGRDPVVLQREIERTWQRLALLFEIKRERH